MNNNTDMTVNEAVVQKMEELRKAGRVNSWYRYRSMLHALESYGGAGIPFERLTPLWLSGCESAWRSSGRNSTTISIYMKSLCNGGAPTARLRRAVTSGFSHICATA